jgi:hypothetical protein
MKAQKKADEKSQKAATATPQQPSAGKKDDTTAQDHDDQDIDPNVSSMDSLLYTHAHGSILL